MSTKKNTWDYAKVKVPGLGTPPASTWQGLWRQDPKEMVLCFTGLKGIV